MRNSRLFSVALLALGFGQARAQSITFAPAVSYNALSGAKVTLIRDFNGDGKLDLGVLGSVFAVLPGNGDGTFGAFTFSTLGGVMINAVAGDFNEDGKQDIACMDGSQVVIYFNSGVGTFLMGASYPVISPSKYLAAAYSDSDAHLDLIVGSQSLAAGTFLKGVGNGTFLSGVNFSHPMSGSTGMSVGDITGDGRPDIVFIGSVAQVDIVRWFGSSYTFMTAFTTSVLPQSVVTPYFDGDSFADVVIANGPQLFSYRSFGTSSFPLVGNAIIGGNGGTPISADLNNDSKADIITTWQAGNQIFHVQGNGTGGFGGAGNAVVHSAPIHVASGDLNGDGRTDLVTTCFSATAVSVLLNKITTTISGHINYGDWVTIPPSTSAQVVLKSGSNILASATVFPSSGNFTMTTTAFGSFTISAEVGHWLRKTVPITLTNSGGSATFNLINGDADLSGEVDAADIDLVIANFGSMGSNPGDLDGSGEVDAADIDIPIAHFGEVDN